MTDILQIITAMLAVFGFYCVLAEIRTFLRRCAQKKNNCARKSPYPFDNTP